MTTHQARQYAATNLGFIRLAASTHQATDELTALRRTMENTVQAVNRLLDAYNTRHHVAGLCARYSVRAGLDASYANPTARDALAADVLAGRAPSTAALSRTNRAHVAAAVLRGWTESYHTPGTHRGP